MIGVPVVGAALVAWLGFGYTFGLHLGRDAFGHRTVIGGPSARAQALIQLVSYLPGWLYNALLQSGPRQATLGQRAVGIKVTDVDGNRIGFARATGRYFATLISTYTLLIGYLMMLWTRRKQCLHDKIADTLVVRSDP